MILTLADNLNLAFSSRKSNLSLSCTCRCARFEAVPWHHEESQHSAELCPCRAPDRASQLMSLDALRRNPHSTRQWQVALTKRQPYQGSKKCSESRGHLNGNRDGAPYYNWRLRVDLRVRRMAEPTPSIGYVRPFMLVSHKL